MLTFDIITIFPEMVKAVCNESMLKLAQQKKKVKIRVHDLRKYTKDKHKKVDDKPFGGGPGMVMAPQPFFDAVKAVKGRRKAKVILTCATGKRFDQRGAKKLSKEKNIILLCGHYEGIDERVREKLVDKTVSIGDYVLTGGEIPAMAVVDAVTRLVPGVLGAADSLKDESFERNLLEYPQYTRPADFRGLKVPQVLRSGNHKNIEKWRKAKSVERTKKWRPDLLKKR